MVSINPRKQRKSYYNAPLHKKRKWISAHLEENLLLKYDRRSLPVIKGDTVKVMRGSFKGHENKIVKVHVKRQKVEIEGLTLTKADGKKIAKPLHASNLLITKLNLTDKWRRNKLASGLSEETKKEIEKEAKDQMKQKEEEQRRLEEETKAAEEAALAEKEAEEEIEEKEETDEVKNEEKIAAEKTLEKLEKKPPEKKTIEKSDKENKENIEKTTDAMIKTTVKKPSDKKTTPKKKGPEKKTSTKISEKKEEIK